MCFFVVAVVVGKTLIEISEIKLGALFFVALKWLKIGFDGEIYV